MVYEGAACDTTVEMNEESETEKSWNQKCIFVIINQLSLDFFHEIYLKLNYLDNVNQLSTFHSSSVCPDFANFKDQIP